MKISHTPGMSNVRFQLTNREREHLGISRFVGINFLKSEDKTHWAVLGPLGHRNETAVETYVLNSRATPWQLTVPNRIAPKLPYFGIEEVAPQFESGNRLIVPRPEMQKPVRRTGHGPRKKAAASETKQAAEKVTKPEQDFDMGILVQAVNELNEAKDHFQESIVFEVDDNGYVGFVMRVGR